MKHFGVLFFLTFSVLAPACTTLPAETPESVPVDLPFWTAGPGNLAIHPASGLTCPETVGAYTRVEFSELDVSRAVGHKQIDGICQYSASEPNGFMTAYIYQTNGMTLPDELQNVLSSANQANDVEVMGPESAACSDLLEDTLTIEGNAIRPDRIKNGIPACTVLSLNDGSLLSLASLQSVNGWFLKTRITSRTFTPQNKDILLDAALQFHTAQPDIR